LNLAEFLAKFFIMLKIAAITHANNIRINLTKDC